jgi:hypothetical protein
MSFFPRGKTGTPGAGSLPSSWGVAVDCVCREEGPLEDWPYPAEPLQAMTAAHSKRIAILDKSMVFALRDAMQSN